MAKTILIDTHSHLFDEQFEDQFNEVLDKAIDSQIVFFNASYSLESSNQSTKLARRFPGKMFSLVGIHPNDIKENFDSLLVKLEEIIKRELELDQKSKTKTLVGVGEIGLDYHYEGYNKELQIKAFKKQIELAIKYGLTISIHCRDAFDDLVNILNSYGTKLPTVVFHTYANSKDDLLKLKITNYFVSFSGVLTYKKNTMTQEVLTSIPLDKVVFETDAPWLAPMPHRGKTNMPWFIEHTYEFAANLLSMDLENLKEVVAKNVSKLFGVTFKTTHSKETK